MIRIWIATWLSRALHFLFFHRKKHWTPCRMGVEHTCGFSVGEDLTIHSDPPCLLRVVWIEANQVLWVWGWNWRWT